MAAGGGALLDQLQAALEKPAGKEVWQVRMDRFKELLESLEPTEDPESTFLAMLAKVDEGGGMAGLTESEEVELFATLGVRFAQWFAVDPKAALAMSTDTSSPTMERIASAFVYFAAADLCEKQGLRAAMDWLDRGNVNFVMMQVVGNDLGKRGSLEDLRWLVETHPDFTSNGFFGYSMELMAGSWPLDRIDELMDAMPEEAKARVAFAIARRMDGEEGLEWIRSRINDGRLRAEELGNNVGVGSLVDQVGGSMAERIALLQEFGAAPEHPDHGFKSQMISRELNDFLNRNSDDWGFAFRSGEASAQDVLDAALASCPDPGPEMGEFRGQLYRHLAEDDPERALALLDGMSETDKDWQKAYAVHWWFHDVNPEKLYDFASSVSCEGNPDMEIHLRQGWQDKSREYLERLGEDYAGWVMALPEGTPRTWALEGLNEATAKDYPEIHALVSAMLEEDR